jgi:hypothetical protein
MGRCHGHDANGAVPALEHTCSRLPEAHVDRLTELLAGITDFDTLSDVDLENLKLDLKQAARDAREGELTTEVTALIRQAAEQVVAVNAEQTARAEAAAQIVADADAAIALLGDDEDETPEGETPEQPEVAETPEGEEPAPEAPEAPAETPEAPEAEVAEPIAASARPAPKRPVAVPARHQPRANKRSPALIASGELKGIGAGHQFNTIDEMNEAIHSKWVSMRSTPDGVPHVVASVDYRDMYGDDRRITGGDAFEVSNKLMGYIAKRNEELAMVASGGVPGPAEPTYSVITYGQADRPLRDGLPSVLMSRGSTVLNTSPVLSAIVLDTGAGAIGTVTAAADLAGATKDIQEIPAPVSVTVTVEAETMRFSQGNFADRFLPEWTAGFMKLGNVAFARHNDALRLADIKAGCTKYTDTPAKFGAYRDLKRAFLGQTEELEDLVRDFNLPIRVLLPEYVPAMLASDLIAQAPGDAAWSITEERVRADIESWDPRVNITWLKDSIRGRLSTSPSGQSPRSAGFDADVEWAMFPEGAFVFGDGGQLDLGILRDTVVSATNKFQTFFESWEAILQLIPSSLCFWLTSSLCANGASQAAAAVNVCSPQGS